MPSSPGKGRLLEVILGGRVMRLDRHSLGLTVTARLHRYILGFLCCMLLPACCKSVEVIRTYGFDRTYTLSGTLITETHYGLPSLSLVLQAWAPEGTTPEGRGFSITAFPDGKPAVSIDRPHDGKIANQWVTDLNTNGHPEVVLAMQSFGTGAYGSIIIFEWTGTAFLQANVTEWDASMGGYMGHDQIHVDGEEITRVYPIYMEDDSNSRPTGGWKHIRYGLQNMKLQAIHQRRKGNI